MNIRKSLVALCACSAAGIAFADPGVSAAEAGVWVKRTYTLQFMGFTSTYSCDGLASKLKTLVQAAGARADVKVSPGACSGGFGSPDKFARASVTFYALVPVAQAKSGEADAATAPGAWQAVDITQRSPREMESGDCELVEQFRDQVLPLFAHRNVDDRITCIPNQQSGSSYSLRFDVFKPASSLKP